LIRPSDYKKKMRKTIKRKEKKKKKKKMRKTIKRKEKKKKEKKIL